MDTSTTGQIPTDHAALVTYLRNLSDRDRARAVDLLAAQYREQDHADPLAMAARTWDQAMAEIGDDPAEPIPTDPHALYEYLREMVPGEQIHVTDRLAIQLGGTPDAVSRAVDLVSAALQEIDLGLTADRAIARFAEHLADAGRALHAAQRDLDALMGETGGDYHGDYADTRAGLDVRAFLDDSERSLRAAVALNPCQPKGTGR